MQRIALLSEINEHANDAARKLLVLLTAERDQRVLSVIALGHGLGKLVTAEGAETAGELTLLKALGCDMAQGYHIARPLPVGEFVARFCAAPASLA